MKIHHIMLFAAMPLVCLCTKNIEPVPQESEGIKPGDRVTLTAEIPQTKVSLTAGGESDPALVLSWESADKLVVKGTSESEFSLTEMTDSHRAIFEGEAVSGSSFDVYYPASDILSRSYEGQIQNGNASTAHLQFNAVAEGLTSYESVAFTKVNGAIKLVVKVPSSVTEVSSISVTSKTSAGEDQAVFFKTNDASGEKTATMSLGFTEGTAPASGILTAYAMVSWNDVELASGSKILVNLAVPGKACTYQKTITLTQAFTVAGGKTAILDLSDAAALAHVIAGSGTEADPYLLYDVEDMLEMNSLLVLGETKYFKLKADVDMAGVDWSPENQASPYTKHIDFDGENHTISNFTCTKTGVYSGFIGVLSGRIANVVFDKPAVSGNKHSGIICGYAGTSGTKSAIVENVTIKNGTITQTGSAHTGFIFGHSNVAGCEFKNINVEGTLNQNGIGDSGFIGGAQNKAANFTSCHASGTLNVSSSLAPTASTNLPTGGIQGYSANSTFTNCSFTGAINGGRLCGGIVGYNTVDGITISGCYVDAAIKVLMHGSKSASEDGAGIVGFLTGGTISNCYTKGSLEVLTQIAGGIVGNIKGMSTITNCWSSMNITAARNAGGIVARASSDSWNTSAAKCLELSGCVYFGTKIDVAAAANNNGSSGSIIGFTCLNNVVSNSWRINDSLFTFVNTGNTDNSPADQPDGCADWVKGTTPQVGTGSSPQQYLFPYWGKAADSGATVTSTVTGKNLGWSTSIWDLSGDFPKLINNPEPSSN